VGALLRASRLRCAENVDDVAHMLRIRAVHLEAIEEGRFADLPGPTYALGFVRAYADYLGLDSAEVVRRYKQEISEVTKTSDLVFPSPIPEGGVPGGAIMLVGVVIALVAYGAWYVSTSDNRIFTEVISPLPARLAALFSDADPVAPEAASPAPPNSLSATADETAHEAPADALASASQEGAPPPPLDAPAPNAEGDAALPAPDSREAREAPETAPENAPENAPETAAETVPPAEAAGESADEETPAVPPVSSVSSVLSVPSVPSVPSVSSVLSVPSEPSVSSVPSVADTAAAVAVTPPAADATANATSQEETTAGDTPVAPSPEESLRAAQVLEDTPPAAPETTDDGHSTTAAVESGGDAASPANDATGGAGGPRQAETTSAASQPADAAGEVPSDDAGAASGGDESTTVADAGEQSAALPQEPAEEPAEAPSDTPVEAPVGAAPSVAPPAQSAAEATSRIVVRAKTASWIQVRDSVANQLLLTRLLRAGDTYKVPDRAGLQLLTGNAGALEILVDGEAVPAIGPVGAVRRGVALDTERLREGTASDE
jgi:cytoskeletal protein RodZ